MLCSPLSAAMCFCRAKKNADIDRVFKGFMIESYLVDGRQDIGKDETPGCSITDPCLGWEKTEKLIYEIAENIH